MELKLSEAKGKANTLILETGKKVIVALNMSDEAREEGIEIDEKQLSALLGVPCIKTAASTGEGIDELKEAIVEVYNKRETTAKIIYSDPIEEEIRHHTKTMRAD